jgi:hypothetical protein
LIPVVRDESADGFSPPLKAAASRRSAREPAPRRDLPVADVDRHDQPLAQRHEAFESYLLLAARGLDPSDVERELERRRR